MLKTHIKYICEDVIPPKYNPQVIGSLLITGREWWDFVSYHPKAGLFVKRAYSEKYRDEINKIREALDIFMDKLEKTRQKAFSI